MKTGKSNTEQLTVPAEPSIDLLRSLALMQYNDEDYFLLVGIEARAFEGTEAEAKEQWDEYLAGCKDNDEQTNDSEPLSFYEWVCENLTEVEEFNTDDYNNDYMVLTDEEADEKCTEYIKESLWAFNASFLAGETGIDEEVFTAIQANNRCESNNSAIERLIEDMEGFVDSAISADGRGHFMSSYDGEETEETVCGETFYIYRLN